MSVSERVIVQRQISNFERSSYELSWDGWRGVWIPSRAGVTADQPTWQELLSVTVNKKEDRGNG